MEKKSKEYFDILIKKGYDKKELLDLKEFAHLKSKSHQDKVQDKITKK